MHYPAQARMSSSVHAHGPAGPANPTAHLTPRLAAGGPETMMGQPSPLMIPAAPPYAPHAVPAAPGSPAYFAPPPPGFTYPPHNLMSTKAPMPTTQPGPGVHHAMMHPQHTQHAQHVQHLRMHGQPWTHSPRVAPAIGRPAMIHPGGAYRSPVDRTGPHPAQAYGGPEAWTGPTVPAAMQGVPTLSGGPPIALQAYGPSSYYYAVPPYGTDPATPQYHPHPQQHTGP